MESFRFCLEFEDDGVHGGTGEGAAEGAAGLPVDAPLGGDGARLVGGGDGAGARECGGADGARDAPHDLLDVLVEKAADVVVRREELDLGVAGVDEAVGDFIDSSESEEDSVDEEEDEA